ncbi:type I polyketide synthase [Aquimarina rhabdastrellae]
MKRDIAIIGMSGRFPKSNSIEEFWENLVEEKELIHFFSDQELEEKGVEKKELNQEHYVKASAYVENTNVFDYPFFKYTLDEARIMNPQTRLMHHLVWEALEDAGCNIEEYTKKIGIFFGANKDLNWSLHASLTNDLNVDHLTKEKLSNPNFMASLIAYKLNFKGPCYFIDTACSTSLSTTHLACRSLLLNECGTAVVGGVRLLSREDNGYKYVEGTIMSKDGHNRSFDSESSGTIGSDGAGVVVLKRLEDALKDNDNIYAVIKGSAMNNDGKAKAGYTMPSVEGQFECIKLAQKIAGVAPTDVTYIETHGTATKIGDPIEIEALNKVFNNDTNHKCAIGTIKSNMGHADEAAGITGLIKTALAINNKIIPASLHYKKPNKTINFNEGPFYVNHASQKWESENQKPLTAGVSSLGIGGTNVHVVLQEAPVVEKRKTNKTYKLIRYSAKTETALEQYEDKLLKFVENNDIDIFDLSYTMQLGRKRFDFVKYLAVKDNKELITSLKEKNTKTTIVKPKSNIVFMFSGQGSQYINMGKNLYDIYPVFKQFLDNGFNYLEDLSGINYRGILFNNTDEAVKKINQTIYTQPLLFVFEYALAQLLITLGVRPTYMIGHSLGEYIAATISGVFSFEEALKIISRRAELMAKVPEGDMLSIAASLQRVRKEVLRNVSIAAINAHDSFVVSGAKNDIDLVKKELEKEEILFTVLKTSHAFHSSMMDVILEDFEEALKNIKLQKPQIPFISNITGDFITEEEATSVKYWSNHITAAVEFEKGIKKLLAIDYSLFIEIGPGRTLTSFFKKSQNQSLSNDVLTTVRHPKENIDDNEFFTKFLGELWSNGLDIDWEEYYKEDKPNKISIPTYAFDEYDIPSKVTLDDSIVKKENLLQTKKEISKALFIPSWKYVPRSKKVETVFSKEKRSLVFNNDSPFGKKLIAQLKQDNKEVIEVVKGNQFNIDLPNKITINPDSLSDYNDLLLHLETINFEHDFIVYAWELNENSSITTQNSYLGYNMKFNNILKMIKAFKLEETTDPKKVVIISNKNYRVTGSEDLKQINQHTHTLLKVLTQESKNVYASCIDIDLDSYTLQDIVAISNELEISTKFCIVAFRNDRRWIPYYQPLQTEEKENYRTPVIKKNGNYIITGTLDNIQYILTNHLLKEYQTNIITLTDKNFDEWNDESKGLYEKLKKQQGTITISYVDISDYESLSSEIENIENRFVSIDGIIHMARNVDVTQAMLVEDIMEDTIKKHFLPRVNGLINIDRIVKEKAIDFVKIISSLSSFLGGITYGAYASASAQMDNIVLRNNKENWSILNLDKVDDEDPWIKQNELINVFHYSFLHSDIKQVLVSKRNLNNLPDISDKKKSKVGVQINRKIIKTTYTAPKTDTESLVINLFENLFGVTGLGIKDDFFELGGDSLKAVLLINKLRKDIGVVIKMSDIFSNKTIEDISIVIDQIKWMQEEDNEIEEVDSIVI